MVGADDIRRLAAVFADRTGIDLERGSQGAALARFVTFRIGELRLPSVDAYLDVLSVDASAELVRLINATTIGLSWLFRDAEQLTAIGELLREMPDEDRPLEIWVPGCARGEDVYSLAMIAASVGRPAFILGTDINADFLEQAQRAEYSAWSTRHVPHALAHHLEPLKDGARRMMPSLRRGVRFARHNLLDTPPAPLRASHWDVVLCRNVLIYFHATHAASTVSRLTGSISPRGWLFLGANDSWSAAAPHAAQIGNRIAFRKHASISAAPVAVSLPRVKIPTPAPVFAPGPEPEPPARVTELLANAADRHVEGRFSEALTLYSEVLQLAPVHNEAHMLLGITHYMMGDHAAAVQALRAALFLDADLWPAAFYLALSHDKLGNRAEAARAYRQVLIGAQKPRTFGTVVLDQLGVWKADIAQLARARAGRLQ